MENEIMDTGEIPLVPARHTVAKALLFLEKYCKHNEQVFLDALAQGYGSQTVVMLLAGNLEGPVDARVETLGELYEKLVGEHRHDLMDDLYDRIEQKQIPVVLVCDDDIYITGVSMDGYITPGGHA